MKRFFCLCFFSIFFLFGVTNIYAKEITKESNIELSNGEGIEKLIDGITYTKVKFATETKITIENYDVIHGLYIIWDKPPGNWTLSSDDSKYIQYGEKGFLHEYVKLEEPIELVRVIVPAGATVCDIYVFSEGELPSFVQTWNEPYDDADMLLLPTHADDEHIFFGGTMPYYAGEKGYKVQVAYLTNHWAEPYRPHELLNGLWTVGITAYPVIGEFIDYYSTALEHAKGLYNLDSVIAHQVELIRRFKPEVIIGHDINGEYGHGVHMLNTYTLRLALDKCSDEKEYVESATKYGVWDVPKTYLHLYNENQITMDWDKPLDAFGGLTAFEVATKGFNCHKSQTVFYSVSKYGVYNCQLFGLYRTTVGEDIVKEDFFENIAFQSMETTANIKEPEGEPPKNLGEQTQPQTISEIKEITSVEESTLETKEIEIVQNTIAESQTIEKTETTETIKDKQQDSIFYDNILSALFITIIGISVFCGLMAAFLLLKLKRHHLRKKRRKK